MTMLPTPTPFAPANVLLDFAELSRLLAARLQEIQEVHAREDRVEADPRDLAPREDRLDAFLFAAGMNQVVEDYLHRDVLALGKVGKKIHGLPTPLGPVASVGTRTLLAACFGARASSARERRLMRWQRELASLVQRLADGVATGMQVDGEGAWDAAQSLRGSAALLAAVDGFPRELRRSVVRLAPCFRSFDQHPQDLARIARAVADRWPERGTRLLVVGLRTSGSYLAPLYASLLEAQGYAKVETWTFRPGQRSLPGEERWLKAMLRSDPLVLVADDPPRTGKQLAMTAEYLESRGFRPSRCVLLLQLLGPEASSPRVLRARQAVVLPWESWSIHDRLSCANVRAALRELLVGRSIAPPPGEKRQGDVAVADVEDVERIDAACTTWSAVRGHAKASFRVTIRDGRSGDVVAYRIHARGVGLGYFGRRTLLAARLLCDFVPETYGVDDGVLYRAWVPEEWRWSPRSQADAGNVAAELASYVVARSRALAVREDLGPRLGGRAAAWEVIGDMLAEAFGRARLIVRPFTDRVARRLLASARPSLVDGAMALSRWFVVPALPGKRTTLVKVESPEEYGFAKHSLDPVLDLASAAADYAARLGPAEGACFGDLLQGAYSRSVSEEISPEKWLLYQLLAFQRVIRPSLLANVSSAGRACDTEAFAQLLQAERAMEALYQRYWSTRVFADVGVPTEGPLCAIDIDGTLEMRWLSLPAIGPAGALALRALLRHGFRPILATGRSLEGVRARCAAYRLAGGVAEYGAGVYNHVTGEVRTLLHPEEEGDLDRLRSVLLAAPGVALDPAHRHSVRACAIDREGQRSGLPAETIEAALASAGVKERLRVIRARTQTDFAVARIDKGIGVRRLVQELGGAPLDAAPLAFAAGDSVSDLPLFELATHSFAAKGAAAALRRRSKTDSPRGRLARGSTQTGLLEAVSRLVGHGSRPCAACRLPEPQPGDARLLLAVLGGLTDGGWEKLRYAALLAVATLPGLS